MRRHPLWRNIFYKSQHNSYIPIWWNTSWCQFTPKQCKMLIRSRYTLIWYKSTLIRCWNLHNHGVKWDINWVIPKHYIYIYINLLTKQHLQYIYIYIYTVFIVWTLILISVFADLNFRTSVRYGYVAEVIMEYLNLKASKKSSICR